MSLLRSMGMALMRFGARHASADMQMQEVMKLIGSSHTAEALELMEEYFHLTPEVYANAELVATALRERSAKRDAWATTFLISVLAWLLGLEGRRRDLQNLMDVGLGMNAQSLSDPARWLAGIRESLKGSPPAVEPLAVASCISLLMITGDIDQAILLLDTALGLSTGAGEYEYTSAVLAQVKALPPELAVTYAGMLSKLLMAAGQFAEANWLWKAVAMAEGMDLEAPDLASSLHDTVATMSPNAAVDFLGDLSDQDEWTAAMRLQLLEQYIDLRAADYRDVQGLAGKLSAKLAGIRPGTAATYKVRLASALERQGRLNDALAVFQADSVLTAADPGRRSLKARLEAELPKDMALEYISGAAEVLTRAGQAQEAVGLLESYLAIGPQSYTVPGSMADAIQRLLADRHEAVVTRGILSLVSGLLELDAKDKAGAVAAGFVDAFGGLRHRTGGDHLNLFPLMAIYEIWLNQFHHEAARRPLEICRDLVMYIRKNFAAYGVQLKDRAELIQVSGDLRRQIIRTGQFWADQQEDPHLAAQIATEALLWDAELSQRLLVERFLLEPIRFVQAGPSPVRTWPWREEAAEEPAEASYLPPGERTGSAIGCLDDLGGASAPMAWEPSPGRNRWEDEHASLIESARRVIAKGVDEASLAAMLGARALLLRGSFDETGQLHWLALGSDGSSLQVAARWSGSAGDLGRLRLAAVRHDFCTTLVRCRANTRLPGYRRRITAEVSQALDELRFELGPSGGPDSLRERLQWVGSRIATSRFPYTSRLMLPVLSALQHAPGTEDAYAAWAAVGTERLTDLRRYLDAPDPKLPQEEIDDLTEVFVEEAGQVLGADRLATVLTPEMNLVVQLDDALHSVPIAHLPVAGEPLFRRVLSIRSSITLQLTVLQDETERSVDESQPHSERLLSVSHLPKGDNARRGAVWLQHGFSVLAKRHGLEAYGAADVPAGSVGLLRTALDELRRVRVLAICGHGELHLSGIRLHQDGAAAPPESEILWHGDGCDLRGVEWLWMVSCSIGRLQQSGDLDVEGFCVRLALHRARSIAAFRWPVDAEQAVALVNESVSLYLEAQEGDTGTDPRCRRARALNDARKRFLGDGTRSPLYGHVGLNTAAGCEMFGLG